MSAAPNTYKFRAECLLDVGRLVDRLFGDDVHFDGIWLEPGFPDPLGIPDVEVLIQNPDLEGLRRVMAKIEDGHVMRETLAPIANYTGERIP